MEQFKRPQVILLPTNDDNSDIELHTKRNRLYSKSKDKTNFNYNKQLTPLEWYKQHLYIISDNEIKEDDWITLFTHINKYQLRQVKEIKDNILICYNNELISLDLKPKKIIATTDNTIKVFGKSKIDNSNIEILGKTIPSPSYSFILKYIEEYNKGSIITDILVEYDNLVEDVYGNQHLQSEKDSQQYLATCKLISSTIKVNPKDNTITIKKLKDNWNREEHINDIRRLCSLLYFSPNKEVDFNNQEELNNWINQNL